MNEEREGWFKGEGYEGMHVQGRRWGGFIKERFNVQKGMEYKGSIYDAGPTFESYGVPHGSAGGGGLWLIRSWVLFVFVKMLMVELLSNALFGCFPG